MALGFVLVLESIVAVSACILLFHFVRTRIKLVAVDLRVDL